MVDVDKAVIARYESGQKKFEILVDPELAWKMKQGEDVNMDDLLAALDVFRDVRMGERASEEELRDVFGTTDVYEIARKIVLHGDVHLTTDQRRKMLEEKKKQIATIISKRAINPQTNTPHPVSRILNAMEEARVSVDIFKPAEEQVQTVVEHIRKVLPIRIEMRKIEVRIPAQYASKAYGVLRSYKVLREEWLSDGSLKAVIEVPAGMTDDVLSSLLSLTHGELESRMVD